MFDNVINAMPDMIGKGFPLTKLMHGVGKSSDSLHLDPGELLLTGTLIHLSDQEVKDCSGSSPPSMQKRVIIAIRMT